MFRILVQMYLSILKQLNLFEIFKKHLNVRNLKFTKHNVLYSLDQFECELLSQRQNINK